MLLNLLVAYPVTNYLLHPFLQNFSVIQECPLFRETMCFRESGLQPCSQKAEDSLILFGSDWLVMGIWFNSGPCFVRGSLLKPGNNLDEKERCTKIKISLLLLDLVVSANDF